MKSKILISLVLCIMMLFVTASATSVISEYIETDANGNQYFSTTGSIDGNPNGFVTLLVFKGSTISVDSIMYIDQTTADSDGGFSFLNYVPRTNLGQKDQYTVKIGATALDSAISGGVLALPEDKTAIAGTVVYNFTNKKDATLLLKDPSGTTIQTVNNAENFKFESLEPGTYTLVATKDLHLPATVSVTYSDEAVTNVSVPLYAGDVNADKVINLTDLSMLLSNYKASSVAVDLNADGTVDITDLTALVNNYGRYVAE